MCQENSYLGPPKHFPSAKGWSLNICYSSAHERLTNILVCMFSHPVSEGNVLIVWQSYLQDVLIHAASRYLAREVGDDALGITPALCNQPRAGFPCCYLPLPWEERCCKLISQLAKQTAQDEDHLPHSRWGCEKTWAHQVSLSIWTEGTQRTQQMVSSFQNVLSFPMRVWQWLVEGDSRPGHHPYLSEHIQGFPDGFRAASKPPRQCQTWRLVLHVNPTSTCCYLLWHQCPLPIIES